MTFLKSVVVCLALANVGYFLWIHGIVESAPPPLPSAAMTLKLASEVARDPRAPAPGPAMAGSGIAGSSSGAPADAANDEGAPGLLPPATRCITAGPLRDGPEAANAASALAAGDQTLAKCPAVAGAPP